MEEGLDQLSLIFPDRTAEELRTILLRHNCDIHESIEAILNGEAAAAPTTPKASLSQPHDDDTNLARNSSAIQETHNDSPEKKPATWWDSPTICSPPQRRPLGETAEERRRILLETQRLAKIKEEADLKTALEASMAPSDRGRLAGHGDFLASNQTISNETLNDLMRNPAFLEQLDDDLKVAIELQRRIDEEERTKAGGIVTPGSLAPPIKQQIVSANLAASVRRRLQSLGASFIRLSSSYPNEEDAKLVEKLEAMNKANEEHQRYREELDRVRQQAEASCMQAIKDHLESFLQENPHGTYEAWIEELHPENAHDGMLLEGMSKTIDHRFYVEESDHRKLWNESTNNSAASRQFVPVRQSPAKLKSDGVTVDVVDLLVDSTGGEQDNVGEAREAGTVAPDKDLIAFDTEENRTVQSTATKPDNNLILFE